MAIEPRWCLVAAANVDIRLLQQCTRLNVHQNFQIIASGLQQQVIIYIF